MFPLRLLDITLEMFFLKILTLKKNKYVIKYLYIVVFGWELEGRSLYLHVVNIQVLFTFT